MKSEGRNVLIGLGILVLVAGAYYVGTTSNSPSQTSTTATDQSPTTPAPTTQQETQVSAPSTPAPTKTTVAAETLTTQSENGLACKNVAAQAVAADQASSGQSTTLLKSHYSLSLNNCYYEVYSVFNGGSQTTIKSAPDDDWIAYCADTGSAQLGTYCGMHNVPGRMTEDEFHQLEQQYLTN